MPGLLAGAQLRLPIRPVARLHYQNKRPGTARKGENMDNDYLVRPETLPTWRQRTALRLLNAIGWNFNFKPLPGPHGIAVVYPHTSNWDFPVGLLAKWAVGLHFRWLAKDSLFRGP